MLVTFRSEAYSDITMFGDVAVKLLQLMGHSGTVPGAILAEDVPAALERLKRAVAAQRAVAADQVPAEEGGGEEPEVSLANRAFPLIELLEASAKAGCHVMWDT